MRRSISAEEQYLIYMKRLRDELNTAYTHYEIAKSIREFRHTRLSDFNEAITFFQVTQNANLFATIISIFRFIDTRTDTMQLHNFFQLVRDNLDLFTTSAYRKRLEQRGRDEEECVNPPARQKMERENRRPGSFPAYPRSR